LKITNGSAKFIQETVIEITSTEIKLGDDRRNTALFIGIGLGLIAAVFVPGPGILYSLGGVILGLILTYTKKDQRISYRSEQIEKVKVFDTNQVETKGMGGTVGGAALGGILFGGAGAVVGALAGGNNTSDFNNVAIKFTDGEWVVLSAEGNLARNPQYQNLIKLAGSKNESPF
jgi:hypothetical protein